MIHAFIADLATSIISDATSSLLLNLIESQDEQITLLRGIDSKVQSLIEGDFRAGQQHLLEATDLWRTEPARTECLTNARNCFVGARGKLIGEPFLMSVTAASLAATWTLLGSADDARRWAAIAQDEAETALERELKSVSDWRAVRGTAAEYKSLGRWALTLGRAEMVDSSDLAADRLQPVCQWTAGLRQLRRSVEGRDIPLLRVINVDMKFIQSDRRLAAFPTPYKRIIFEETPASL
jgi:hypothetical protein